MYAVETYKTAIEINPDKYPEVFYFYGILCFEMQQYQLCIEQLEQFKNYNIINEARQKEADYYLASARFAQRSLKKTQYLFNLLILEQILIALMMNL